MVYLERLVVFDTQVSLFSNVVEFLNFDLVASKDPRRRIICGCPELSLGEISGSDDLIVLEDAPKHYPGVNYLKKVFSIDVAINRADNARKIDIIPNLIISILLSEVSINNQSANGKVCVSPGIFPTKAIVAPNSPIDLAKDKTKPAKMPG